MRGRQFLRSVIATLAVALIVTIVGAVVLSSTRGGGVPVSTSDIGSAAGVGGGGDTSEPVTRGVITASGSAAGYDVTLRLLPLDGGTSRLEVSLSTEATPASAPTAQAELRGRQGSPKPVPLTIVGAGRWQSAPLRVEPDSYVVTARFDRQTGPVSVPIALEVP